MRVLEMNRPARYSVLSLAIAAACLAAGRAAADEGTAPEITREWENPSVALSKLQKAHAKDGNTFVVQGELDGLIDEAGGGACASAAGIDVLQTLRAMAAMDKLPNPHRVVLSAFADQRELLQGRVTNDRFIKLISFYRAYLEGHGISIDVESAPNSPYATDKRVWSEIDGPALNPARRQIKIVSYTVTDPRGQVIGRHFVLLKSGTKNEIAVVDPQKPDSDRRYNIEHRAGDQGPYRQAFLVNPPDIPRRGGHVFEINTIFKISLVGDEAAGRLHPGKSTSVDSINRRIDETAAALRGTKDFLDPRVWRKKTADFGLPGLDLPVEFGGSAWPATKMVEVFRHAGEHNLNFRDVVGGAHVRPLLSSKDPDIAKIVRQVAAGEGYMAIAITEPTAGSDVQAIKSSARKVEGGYLLTGQKRFNARLEQATHLILFTQGTTGQQGKLSVFVVPMDTPGLTIERLQAHGLSGNSYGGLQFKDLFVPENHRLGEDGKGLGIFFHHFLYWRLMQSAAAIGTGERALKSMADRIKTREAFGAPIGRFTHLQQALGQRTTELRMAHALALEAADLIDHDDYDGARAIICGLKAEGVEMALAAVDAAMRAFGGEGYSNRVDLGDRLMDLNGLRIADGTTDVMRMDVVRQTFGEEFWNMAVEPRK